VQRNAEIDYSSILLPTEVPPQTMVSVLPDDKMAAQSMRSASVPGKGIAQHAYAHPHVATAV
jgi:hypothetical protein